MMANFEVLGANDEVGKYMIGGGQCHSHA
jgi:hypothetical protein